MPLQGVLAPNQLVSKDFDSNEEQYRVADDDDSEQAAIGHKLLHGTFGKPQESSGASMPSDRDKQFISIRGEDRAGNSHQMGASNQKRPLHTTKKPLSGMAASK